MLHSFLVFATFRNYLNIWNVAPPFVSLRTVGTSSSISNPSLWHPHCWYDNTSLLLFFWVWTANKFIQSLNQVFYHDCLGFLTQFRMDLFGAAHGWRGPKRPSLSKICHTYLTLMKLGTVIPYLKKIQKIYESRDTPLEFCWHQHFFTENQQFLVYQEIQV